MSWYSLPLLCILCVLPTSVLVAEDAENPFEIPPIFPVTHHPSKAIPVPYDPTRPTVGPTFPTQSECPPAADRGLRYLPEKNPEGIPDQKIVYMDPPSTFIPQVWYSVDYWWVFMRDFGGVQRDNGNGVRTTAALWLDEERKNGLGLEFAYVRDTGVQGLITAPLDMFSIFPYYRRMITARENYQTEFVIGYRYLSLTEKRIDPTQAINFKADNDFHLLQGGLYSKFIFDKWFLLSTTNLALGYLNFDQILNNRRQDGSGFRWLTDSNTMLGYQFNKSIGVTLGYQMLTIRQIARIDLFGEKANLMIHGLTFGIYGQY